MSILRKECHERNFTIVENSAIEDSRLSYRARGILLSLLAKPDGWTVSRAAIAKGGRETPHAVDMAFKELYALGYLTQEAAHEPSGRVTGSLVVVHECPKGQVSPTPEDLRDSEKRPPLVSTQIPLGSTHSSRPPVAEREDPLRGFAEFWSAYPRRNGKIIGRSLCVKRWEKLSLEDRRAAWRGAKNYGGAVSAELTIAKDPDRWLRDRLWEDWQEPAVADSRNGASRARGGAALGPVVSYTSDGLSIYQDPDGREFWVHQGTLERVYLS